ncbi:chorismate mutase [Virgibacillus sp. SK37]|uniref:chorismate mutase n=1 Tax=Virgibacillus sp. SK37 TaxID=403957 RepID=UPI0004D15F11|nr:chorismate mutase [Virgibacillus sp. SK37]AIF43571.1 chorismate mutase [Virgibacillus sp. SK37]
MTRGLRGATSVLNNEEGQIIANTKALFEEMVNENDIEANDVSHVFISVTKDLNAAFPAKALRELPGYTFVPVMCMTEIDVPGSLPNCIRIMMVINTEKDQQSIKHIFHNEAVKLRPDLVKNKR